MNTIANSLPQAATTSAWRLKLARVCTAVWHAMQLASWARARGHLLQYADSCEALQPDLAKELRAAAQSGPLA